MVIDTKDCVTPDDRFIIGGEQLLGSGTSTTVDGGTELQQGPPPQREILDDIRVRIGTLLKTETVSFLLGAGASVDCGGQLISSVPLVVERILHEKGITGTGRPRVRRWLAVFYRAVRAADENAGSSLTREEILHRWTELSGDGLQPLAVNLERVLAKLHRWRSALPRTGGRLRIDGSSRLDAKGEDLDAALQHAKRALARVCVLPTDKKQDGVAHYKSLVRKLLTRPLNLRRVNVFTLNYDTLVEQAADAEGVVLLDGCVGTQRRVFRPECYEQDLYFPAETTEGRVHRFDRVLHLYKLHGSITWSANEPTLDDPYGVQSAAFDPDGQQPLLIYPTPAKQGDTLGMPYSELFRRFAAAVTKPQSVLFVIGYGFGDEHVNAIVRQALGVPSFTLVIVDPAPKSEFVTKLREQQDRRVWIAEGPTIGTFAGFVDRLLPDLRDEEVRKKVLATHRALTKTGPPEGGGSDGD